MKNQALIVKVKLRLNKLDSNDYTNVESWMILEAFNSAQALWTRRNLHGMNQKQEGDEQSTSRIDDFQMLLVTTPKLLMNNRQEFFETAAILPKDYLRFKRISANAVNECCPEPRRLVIYIGEEANPDILLRDVNKQPSFEWAETFATFGNNKFKIYTDEKFDVQDVLLTYYRQPRRVQSAGVKDVYTGLTPTVNVECEFNEDLIEVLVYEMAGILAADIESMVQQNRDPSVVEKNN
jgi:hypothetical protein